MCLFIETAAILDNWQNHWI